MTDQSELQALIEFLRRWHRYCEDCWYSCPKSEDGCCDVRQGDKCNCGADEHNARVDAALNLLSATARQEQGKP